jgi:hypothetical protein
MCKCLALLASIGSVVLTAPARAETTTSVQITGTEVENFCYFDGTAFSPGASICDSLYEGRVLTCQPKGNKLPVPPGQPAGTATLNSTVAGWTGAEDPRCARK